MANISISTTLGQLVARSRKLGADRSICNWGGGNTSAKADEIDFRGRPVRVLWVKGSGSDLASVTEASFTGLYLDDVLPLLERERMSDTEMVNYLAHCFYEPGRPRPSIETLLHGFLPFAHVDHTHADATNYFACAVNGEKLARECFGDELIWIPYRRPGFGLAREVALAVRLIRRQGLSFWRSMALSPGARPMKPAITLRWRLLTGRGILLRSVSRARSAQFLGEQQYHSLPKMSGAP